jgi:hypothetical protein
MRDRSGDLTWRQSIKRRERGFASGSMASRAGQDCEARPASAGSVAAKAATVSPGQEGPTQPTSTFLLCSGPFIQLNTNITITILDFIHDVSETHPSSGGTYAGGHNRKQNEGHCPELYYS